MTRDRSLFKIFESKKGGNVTFSDGNKSQIKGNRTISLPGLPDITKCIVCRMSESELVEHKLDM